MVKSILTGSLSSLNFVVVTTWIDWLRINEKCKLLFQTLHKIRVCLFSLSWVDTLNNTYIHFYWSDLQSWLKVLGPFAVLPTDGLYMSTSPSPPLTQCSFWFIKSRPTIPKLLWGGGLHKLNNDFSLQNKASPVVIFQPYPPFRGKELS